MTSRKTTDIVIEKLSLSRVGDVHRAIPGDAVRSSRVGEGMATAAAKLTAQFGFEKLGLQRIEIVIGKENAGSLKVAEKVGAVREGLLRNRLRLHNSPCDAYMHSLIPTDFT